jgi:hypothetical protein
MPRDFAAQVKVLNERWEGKYKLVCDVIVDNQRISGVEIEASPPEKNAEVLLPAAIKLSDDQKGRVEKAALYFYYDIDSKP